MADLTCERCGKRFALDAAVRERYPNWEPKYCRNCHGGRVAGSRPASNNAGARPAGNGIGRTNTAALTPDEVRRAFTGGPQDGVFTDGSCQGNPGPGGWGAVWVENGDIVAEKFGFDPSTTNNRMELTAIVQGLRMLPEDASIDLYSDSRLAVDTLTKWAAGWEKRGWRRKEGEVKNLELVKEAWALIQKRPGVRVTWIRAHDGSQWNEYADALSTAHLRGGGA